MLHKYNECNDSGGVNIDRQSNAGTLYMLIMTQFVIACQWTYRVPRVKRAPVSMHTTIQPAIKFLSSIKHNSTWVVGKGQ